MYTANNASAANGFRRVICFLLALMTVASVYFQMGTVTEVHAAIKKVTIPNPADYFGDVDDKDSGKTYTAYYFEGYSTFPKSKVDKYVKALKNAGLTAGSSDKTGTLLYFKYDGDEKLQIVWNKDSKRGGGYLRINVQDPLTISSSATSTKKTTTTTKTTKTTKTTTTTTKKPTVPNPGDYFGSVDDTDKGNRCTVYYCDGHSTYPKSKMQDYIKALKKAGLTGGTIKSDGSDKVATLKYNNKEKLWIRWDKSKKQMFINISDDLSVAKPTGKKPTTTTTTTTTTPTTPKKPSGGGGLSVLEDCGSCFGSGRCNWCNGKGEIRHRIIGQPGEYSTQTCSSCSGLKKCPSCRGTGHK